MQRNNDEEQLEKTRRFLIGYALFLIPIILIVCIIGLLVTGSLYSLFGLLSLFVPGDLLWVAHSHGYKIL